MTQPANVVDYEMVLIASPHGEIKPPVVDAKDRCAGKGRICT
jgi:hypothetical protein